MDDLGVARPVDHHAQQAWVEILLESAAHTPEALAGLLFLPLRELTHCAGGSVFLVTELD